jgi:hypothetical protein
MPRQRQTKKGKQEGPQRTKGKQGQDIISNGFGWAAFTRKTPPPTERISSTRQKEATGPDQNTTSQMAYLKQNHQVNYEPLEHTRLGTQNKRKQQSSGS